MKKKACAKCRIFVEEEQCPICKGHQFAASWLGRLSVLSSEKSEIAKKVGFAVEGEYAIKVR